MTQEYKIQVSMSQSHIVDSGFVFKQGDFGFNVTIEVLDFDTTGATPKIIWRKSQGAVEGNSFTRVGNVFTYTMQGTELDTPGPGVCDLKLYDSTTKRISTASFKYMVEADTMDGLNDEAHSYSDTIAQIVETIMSYSGDSEAWAIGTNEGVPVTPEDPQYHNNAKYYAEEADNYIETSEAWAKGTKGGVPVTSDEPQYDNNSKHYSEESEAWAKGTSEGIDVSSDAPQYENHAKWFSKDSEAWAAGTRDGMDVTSDADQFQNNSKWYSGVSQFYASEAADKVDDCQDIYDQFINAVGLGTFTYDAATGDLYYETTPGSIYTFSIVDGNLYFDITTP